MRLYISLTAMLIYGAFLLPAACDSKQKSNDSLQARSTTQASPSQAAPEEATPSDGARRVTIAELRGALDRGDAVLVDVRGDVEYQLGHIKGARSMPLGLIAARLSELPRDRLIVTYCA